MRLSMLGACTLLLALSVAAQAATYKIDPSHSVVTFTVRHMMITSVRGSFSDFAGTFIYVPGKPAQWSVKAEIQTASVNTHNERRDEHLRGEDFFDVEKHYTMTFMSSKVETVDNRFKLHGDLTMLGITRPVVLDLELEGEVSDPWGNQRVGFSARGELDRKDWGMTWSQTLDTGGLMVGNVIRIELEIQGIKDN